MKRAARGSARAKSAGSDSGTQTTIDIAPLPNAVGYMLRRAHLVVVKNFMTVCKELDIRPAQYGILTVIENNPGLKQIDVSLALGIKRTNMVALIDALQKRDLVRRVTVRSDRRSYALHLTPKGKVFMSRLRARAARHEEEVGAALGPHGRQQLLSQLRTLQERLPPIVSDDEI
ncbi:MAG: MarR family transcriptional regulator [Pseudorhodoplanes sp.]|nr:MarR family transcriptional regulator [Pseudorhodoplanes sp.]